MKTYSVSEAKKKNSIISEEDFNTLLEELDIDSNGRVQFKGEYTVERFTYSGICL